MPLYTAAQVQNQFNQKFGSFDQSEWQEFIISQFNKFLIANVFALGVGLTVAFVPGNYKGRPESHAMWLANINTFVTLLTNAGYVASVDVQQVDTVLVALP